MSSEKTEDPTDHRLREARKKGQVPTSSEVNSAAGFAAVVGYLLLQAGDTARQLHAMFGLILMHVKQVGDPGAPSNNDVLIEVGFSLARVCLPPVLIGALVAVLAGLAQTRALMSFELATPDLDHVDPIQGFTRVFSVRNLLTLAKLLAGLVVIVVIVVVMFRDMLPQMMRTGYVPSTQTVAMSWYFASRLIVAGVIVAALMAVADHLIQYFSFMRSMRMSKNEITDENKNIEGNPFIKSHQRQFFERLIDESTQKQIEESQVIIANPTHVAIAIRYEPGKYDLPMVAAKGLDEVAQAIRQHAEAAGVPVYENRSLARALYRDCRTREYVSHQYFEAVAEVFKWLAKIKGAKQMVQRGGAREGRA
jgi:flagellar biosynthesis protein FlhB